MATPFGPVTIVFHDDMPEANADDTLQGVATVFTSVEAIVETYRLKPTFDLAKEIASEAVDGTVHACWKPSDLPWFEQDIILREDRESIISAYYAQEMAQTDRIYGGGWN